VALVTLLTISGYRFQRERDFQRPHLVQGSFEQTDGLPRWPVNAGAVERGIMLTLTSKGNKDGSEAECRLNLPSAQVVLARGRMRGRHPSRLGVTCPGDFSPSAPVELGPHDATWYWGGMPVAACRFVLEIR
jgi:hypothetical protein